MCEFDRKSGDTRIDPCMVEYIKKLQENGIKTIACCCGHSKYPPTVVVKNDLGDIYDYRTATPIARKKRIYKRDKEGVYYIPEIVDALKKGEIK